MPRHRERDFALTDEERQREIAGTVRRADSAQGIAHGLDSEESSESGCEGGLAAHHHEAAKYHEAAAHHHRQAAMQHETGEHEHGRQHAATALEHSQRAHEHSQTAHRRSHGGEPVNQGRGFTGMDEAEETGGRQSDVASSKSRSRSGRQSARNE